MRGNGSEVPHPVFTAEYIDPALPHIKAVGQGSAEDKAVSDLYRQLKQLGISTSDLPKPRRRTPEEAQA